MLLRFWKRWIAVAIPSLLLGYAVALPPLARAAAAAAEIAPAAGDVSVNASGAFATSVPIDVPAFRGLEPDLSLSYQSGTGNGFAGVGWVLTGQSVVERAGSGLGVPRYDGNDVFLLNGQELLPGCTTLGGTHCPRQQTFQRIRRDTTNDTWEVWDTDGTKATYAPVFTTPKGTFRWGMVDERDTHGNSVTYTYVRPGSDNAYLDAITYNGTLIKLWREPRPDPVSFTNGVSVGATNSRLKTVEVSTGGSRVRAYQLTYAGAPSTGRSRLISVREYGRDVVLDSSGTITGGSALPAVTLSYQDGTARLNTPSFNASIGGWDPTTIRDMFGDVDGDDKADLVRVYKHSSGGAYAQVSKSNGSGYPTASFNASIGGWNSAFKDFLADVSGDGRADLVRIYQHSSGGAYAQVNLSDGSGFPTQSFNGSVGGWNPCCVKEFLADVDGDARADLVRLYKNGTSTYAQVTPSDGSGFRTPSFNASVGGWNDSTLDYLVDVSGDGKADLVRIWDNGSAYAQVNLSTGSGFPTQSFNGSVGGWNPGHVYNHFSDLNGDGKADLVRIWDNGGAYAQVSLSTGIGYPTPNWNGGVGGWNPSVISDNFTDVNGDGTADLVRVYKQDTGRYVEIRPYDGKGFPAASFNQSIGGWGENTWKSYLVDVGGDAKADVVTIWDAPGSGAYAQVNQAAGVMPDLLTSIGNGIGGSTSVEYVPSSRWWSPGHNLASVFPTVSKMTRSDGQAASFATTHTFADGLWARQPDERRFLGFGSSKVILDGEGTYRETFYRQTLAGSGQVERSYLKNAAGQTYSSTQRSFTESSAAPWLSRVSSESGFECNLTPFCRQSRTDYTYDGYGNVITEVDHGDVARSGDEVTSAFTYAPNTTSYIVGRVAVATQHAGTTTAGAQLTRSESFYDNATSSSTPPVKGDLTSQAEWNSSTGATITSKSQFDQWGNVVSTTDARGSTSTVTFDATRHLFPTRACNALNQCTQTAWDFVLGVPTSVTEANGAVGSSEYDVFGQQVRQTDPAGNATTWEYLDMGDPTRQRVRESLPDGSGDGLWTETYFDGLGRPWQTVKEGPAAGVTYVQDQVYRSTTKLLWKQSQWRQSGQPARYTVFAYDGADRLVRTTHPDGSFATTAYGSGGDSQPFVLVRDELGHETTTWSNVDEELTMVQERNGGNVYNTTYGYDLLGRLIKWTDAAGNSSTVEYNSLGWKTSITDMDTGTWSYDYDDGGLLVRQTDAKSQTHTFTHDALGRPQTQTYPGGGQAQWFYDEAGFGASTGRLTRTVYPGGSESHTWNLLGQETATVQCVDTICKTMASSYDSAGRLKTLTYPDGEVVGHSYDNAGQLVSVGGYVTSMAWDPAGQLASLSYANGTTTSYGYDPNRDWLTSTNVASHGATIYQASYGYNAAGLVTTMSQGTPTPATTTYIYDDLDRLTSVSGAQNQTFTYDATGNITSNSAVGSYTYTDAAHKHAATTAGTATYSYDPNGNMTSGDGRTLTWDHSNRLTSATKAGITTNYAYDPGERRLKKTTGASTTRYFNKFVEEANGTLIKYYYAGPILVARSSGGATSWYHADRLGSTRVMTNADGAEVRDYDYKPFGEQTTTGTAANERTYTGHIHDDSTGLTYMNARYQDAKLGRFISPDSAIPTLADPQDINRYSYVHNNPINNTDPTGHVPSGAACGPDGYKCGMSPDVDKNLKPRKKKTTTSKPTVPSRPSRPSYPDHYVPREVRDLPVSDNRRKTYIRQRLDMVRLAEGRGSDSPEVEAWNRDLKAAYCADYPGDEGMCGPPPTKAEQVLEAIDALTWVIPVGIAGRGSFLLGKAAVKVIPKAVARLAGKAVANGAAKAAPAAAEAADTVGRAFAKEVAKRFGRFAGRTAASIAVQNTASLINQGYCQVYSSDAKFCGSRVATAGYTAAFELSWGAGLGTSKLAAGSSGYIAAATSGYFYNAEVDFYRAHFDPYFGVPLDQR